MEDIRIAKFLAGCGILSRRKCEQLVLDGRISVNGEIVKELSKKILPCDKVELDGKIVNIEKRIVIALNKPAGYLSTVNDKFARKTVLDLVPSKNLRLYPVGRLDLNSRGLIILTNDGSLAYMMTHPKFAISKVYEVIINKKIKACDLEKISKGIEIEGRPLKPVNLKLLNQVQQVHDPGEGYSHIRIEIAEGRKRIIRKVFGGLGYDVMDLKRIQIGNFKLSDYGNELNEGKFKILNEPEIKKLLNI
jgi:23S rRNA pseudouridine2605 synthase